MVAAIAQSMLWLALSDGVWIDLDRAAKLREIAPAEYVVWAWAPAAQAVSVTIGADTVSVPRRRGEVSPDENWRRIGALQVAAPAAEVTASPGVSGLLLSRDPDFDPVEYQRFTRALPGVARVQDRRAERVRDTNTVFTMPRYPSLAAWEEDAQALRRRILLSSGLWPLPERTPLNARIFDRQEFDGYSVEKVYFEAWPGLLVTGNLYRPADQGPGPFPGVVNPHGHWGGGRLEDSANASVPGRCITLARMGMVAFSYDMTGYVDNTQFSHNWIQDTQKLWGVHPFSVQLWTAIRAVDFLESLPDVDPGRLAATGASGGGTQTFTLMAVDSRIRAAAPVNMISSTMQGGCICENAPILRLRHSNMEIAALMAPRPLLLVSATGDWTRETPRVEYPAIRSVYELHGAAHAVSNVHIDAGHNFNQASREAVYRFLGEHLLPETDWTGFAEPPFEVPPAEALRVFPDGVPEQFPKAEALIASLIEGARERWDAQLPRHERGLAAFRARHDGVLADVLGVEIPGPGALDPERTGIDRRDGYVIERWILHTPSTGAAVPAMLYRADESVPAQPGVLLLHPAGKAAFAASDPPGPGPLVTELLEAGRAVLLIDPFQIGEAGGASLPNRPYADTFHPTVLGCRVQDAVTALRFLEQRRDITADIRIAGLEGAGVWAMFAAAIDQTARDVFADLADFDFEDDQAWAALHYAPCIRAIGGLRSAAALIAPRPLAVARAAHPLRFAGVWTGPGLDLAALSAHLTRDLAQ